MTTMQDDRLAGVRTQRASLRQAFSAVEQALATPLSGRPEQWREHLTGCLEQLRRAWTRHIAVTESPDGLFEQIQVDAPRLAPQVRKLHQEHDEISSELDAMRTGLAEHELATELSAIRAQGTAVLSRVMRHRQRGADLIYEAYERDIGGE